MRPMNKGCHRPRKRQGPEQYNQELQVADYAITLRPELRQIRA